MPEYELYATGKHQLFLASVVLGICLMVAFLFIISSDLPTFLRFGGAGLFLAVGKSYFIYSYFKNVNKKPVLKIDPIGIHIQPNKKLYPWALIDHAEIKSFSSSSELLYQKVLEIKQYQSDEVISYPIDDLAAENEEVNSIIDKFLLVHD